MEFGVHLPLLAFRGQAFSLSRLVDYAEAAEQLFKLLPFASDAGVPDGAFPAVGFHIVTAKSPRARKRSR